MEFGVFDHLDATGAPLDAYYADRLAVVELYDKLGFRTYHLAEHHATPLGMAPSPSVFLAAVASRTTRLRFGPLVYALPLYHPIRLAEEICMLDQLSGGRLEIGFGRGASPIELGFFGRAREEAEAIYQEYLDAVLSGLADGTMDAKGKYVDLEDVPLLVSPKQTPHPPLWYGMHSPDSAARAARQGCNVVSLDVAATTRELAAAFRDALDGKPEPLIGLGVFVTLAASDDEALAVARRAYPVWHESFYYLFERSGTRPVHMRPGSFDEMAAEGRAVAGSPATVANKLAALMEEATATYLVGQFAYGNQTRDEMARTVELFAAEVMPALASAKPGS